MNKLDELVNSKVYRGITANVCRNHHLKEDLHAEAILLIIEKGYDLNVNTNLAKFFAAIVWLTWKSNKFKKKYIHEVNESAYISITDTDLIDEDVVITFDSIKSKLNDIDTNEFEYYEKELLRLYVKLGDCKAISKQTNIPYRTVANDIKNIKDNLKKAHNEENNN